MQTKTRSMASGSMSPGSMSSESWQSWRMLASLIMLVTATLLASGCQCNHSDVPASQPVEQASTEPTKLAMAEETPEQKLECALSPAALEDRKGGILAELQSAMLGSREIENGYAYAFASTPQLRAKLEELIRLEAECCDFLAFEIVPHQNPQRMWLEVSGPEGTRDFLQEVLGWAPPTRSE